MDSSVAPPGSARVTNILVGRLLLVSMYHARCQVDEGRFTPSSEIAQKQKMSDYY